MPALTSILIGAGLALSAGGTLYSGIQASNNADKQADLQDKQAAMELEAAQAEAGQIREKARRVKATQRAGLVASGVSLEDGGSPDAILAETTRLSEQDAMAALAGGTNRAALLNDSAGITRSKGDAAELSGFLNAGATLVGGANELNKAGQKGRMASKIGGTDLELSAGAQKFATASRPKYSLLGG